MKNQLLIIKNTDRKLKLANPWKSWSWRLSPGTSRSNSI